MLSKKRKLVGLIGVIVLMFLVGCIGGTNVEDPKRIDEMTSKEKGTWMMGVYNAQAIDYKVMVNRTDLTNDQKEMLRQKKKIAQQVWPLINTYQTYINVGAVPTQAMENQIIGLINDLTVLVLPHVIE